MLWTLLKMARGLCVEWHIKETKEMIIKVAMGLMRGSQIR